MRKRLPRSAIRARFLAWRWLVIGLLLHSVRGPRLAMAEGNKPVVHVFLQLDVKASVLEKTLQAHLPDLTIIAFGRFRDFEDGLANGHPDAVVSITPVLQQRGKTPALRGQRAGKGTERYVLASVGKPLEPALSGKSIGVVDLLGRDGTQAFVNDLLGATDLKIKRVAKVEDLLPLLEFSAADAILLADATLTQLLVRTRLVIKTREVPGAPVGLPAVAILNPAVGAIVLRSFQALDAPTNHLLGIDTWSVR